MQKKNYARARKTTTLGAMTAIDKTEREMCDYASYLKTQYFPSYYTTLQF